MYLFEWDSVEELVKSTIVIPEVPRNKGELITIDQQTAKATEHR